MILTIATTFGVKIDKNEILTHVKSFTGFSNIVDVTGFVSKGSKGIAYLLKCLPWVGIKDGGIINEM